jgi:hypothetical protein
MASLSLTLHKYNSLSLTTNVEVSTSFIPMPFLALKPVDHLLQQEMKEKIIAGLTPNQN